MYDRPPIMRQIDAIRREAPEGSLLAVEMGEFFYFFNEDATKAAPVIGCGIYRRGTSTLMCGVNCHDIYDKVKALTDGGFTVCIVSQMEPVNLRRRGGVMRREITQIFRPSSKAGV